MPNPDPNAGVVLPAANQTNLTDALIAGPTSSGITQLTDKQYLHAAQHDYKQLTHQLHTISNQLREALEGKDYAQASALIRNGLALPRESKKITPTAGQHDMLIGSGHNDILDLSNLSGYNIAEGKQGNDTLTAKNFDLLLDGNGNDHLISKGSNNVMIAGNGINTLTANSHDIAISGNGSGSFLDASKGSGHNLLWSGNGNNLVLRAGHDDVLVAGNGVNVSFHAGTGGSLLVGGEDGKATYYIAEEVLPSKANTISQFKPGIDKLKIVQVKGINSFSDLKLVQVRDSTLVRFGNTQIALLEDVDAEDIRSSDFQIVHYPPVISAHLLNDNGSSSTDGITTDASVTGTIIDQGTITSLKAGLDGTSVKNFTDVSARLSNGSFVLDQNTMNKIAGGSLSAGAHTLHLVATDQFNNTSQIFNLPFTFVVDNVPPQISAALLNDNGHSHTDGISTDPTVTGQIADSFKIASFKLALDANPTYTDATTLLDANNKFTVSAALMNQLAGGTLLAGNHTLHMQAVDEYGVSSPIQSFNFTYVIDNTPPINSISLINDTGISNTDKITTDASVRGQVNSQFQIASVKVGLDSTPRQNFIDITNLLDSHGNYTLSNTFIAQLAGGTLPSGQHTLHLLSTDEYGVQSALTDFSFTYVIDNSPPVVHAALLNSTGTVGSNITTDATVSGSVSSPFNITVLKAGLDNANPLSFTDLSSSLHAGGTFVLSNATMNQLAGGRLGTGQHTLYLTATDEYGLNSTTQTLTFTFVINTTPPMFRSVGLQNDTGISHTDGVSHDPTVVGQIQDMVQVVSLKAGLDGALPANFKDISATLSPNGNFVISQALMDQLAGGSLARGPHTLLLQATDSTNLTSNIFSYSFTYNKPFEVMPGAQLSVKLSQFFNNLPQGTSFTVQAEGVGQLPTSFLKANGTLLFTPSPTEIGTFDFQVVARSGNTTTTQEFSVAVKSDPITTTRLSGKVIELDGTVIPGLTIELNGDTAVSDANGNYTITITHPLNPGENNVIFRGDSFINSQHELYAFLAERLNVLLGHDLYQGFNNVIARPEFIPVLDLANAHTVDPNLNLTFTTAAIPGVALQVQNHTLVDQNVHYFTGQLSITEMPVDKMPIARPPELFPDLVIAIQPGNMSLTAPAQLTMPNRAGYSVGTQMDLWSISAATGTFQKVGTGIVQSDGLIHTTSGGVQYTDWHFFAPTPGQRTIGGDNNNPNGSVASDKSNPEDDCGCSTTQTKVNAHSMVNAFTGVYTESHSLPTYQSIGERRGITLSYNSLSANPLELLNIPTPSDPNAPNEDLVATIKITDGKLTYLVPGYIDANGNDTGRHYWRMAGERFVEGTALLDMRDIPTGAYTVVAQYGVNVVDNTTGNILGTQKTSSYTLTHVNASDSYFGSGWGIQGLLRIHQGNDGSAMIVDGDGSIRLFQAPSTPGGNYIAPEGVFSKLAKQNDGTFLYTMKDQTQYVFDSKDRLSKHIDSNGNTTTYQYNSAGNLSNILDPAGLQTTFNYTNGKVSSIVDPFGRTSQLHYDINGNLTGVTDPDGTAVHYSYNDQHQVTQTQDQRGNASNVFYNAAGRADHEMQADGSTIIFDPLQSKKLTNYAGTFNPQTAPAGYPVFTALQASPTTQPKDANGNILTRVLNQHDQPTSESDSIGSIATRTYNSLHELTSIVDGNGNETDYTYDSNGNLLSVSDSLSASSGALLKYFDISSKAGAELAAVSNTHLAASTLVNLPFNFTFYGQTYSQIGVSNNGLLSFGGVNSNYQNVDLSSAGAVAALNNLPTLAPFWHAFETTNPNNDLTSHVFTHTTGNAGERKFIIQWQQRSAFNSGRAIYDFETVFSEGTNEINFSYSRVNGGGADGGLTATVGIWNPTGQFQQYNFNGSHTLNDGQSLAVSQQGFTAAQSTGRGATTYTYDGKFNKITSVTDDLGHKTLYDIDPNTGNVLSMTVIANSLVNGETQKSFYEYNNRGQLSKYTDPLGHVTTYDYDNLGRMITVTRAKGTVDETISRYEHDVYGNVSAVIDPNGNRTEYSYDLMNRVVQIKEADPNGAGPANAPITNLHYDEYGNLTKITDALGHITQFQYDVMNRLSEKIDPFQNHRDYTYDHNGNLLSVKDELSRTTQYAYDARDRRISMTDANNNLTRYFYDNNDNLTIVFHADGGTETYSYDARNRMTKSINTLGLITNYAYDADNNLTGTSDNNLLVRSYGYDSLNRLVYSETQGGSSITPSNYFINYQYDNNNHLVHTTDQLGRTSSSVFDNLDRLITSIDPAGGQTRYRYDKNGNLVLLTDSVNNSTSYGYDALNRQISDTDALNHRASYKYDAVGNLVDNIDRNGQERAFQYDALNRRTKESWVGTNTTFNYAYDAVGNLSSASDPYSHITRTYDNNNNITSEDNSGTPNIPKVVMNYSYGVEDRLASESDTTNGVLGATDTYQYNLAGEMTSATETGTGVDQKQAQFTYTNFGALQSIFRFDANHLISFSSYSYDQERRLTGLDHNGNGFGLRSFAFNYDAANQLSDRSYSDLGYRYNAHYSYDNLGRLTAANYGKIPGQPILQGAPPDESFTYDANGNRLSAGGPSYTYGAGNRLMSDGVFNYAYDNNGNMISKTSITTGFSDNLSYDFRNRLTQVVSKDNLNNVKKIVGYRYDCFDRRISKTVDSDPANVAVNSSPTTFYMYDGVNVRMEFTKPDGTAGGAPAALSVRYFNGQGVDNVIAQENYSPQAVPGQIGSTYWLIKDQVGSTTDVLNANGQQVNHIDYTTFGQFQILDPNTGTYTLSPTPPAGTVTTHLFTGREFNAETGDYYYRAREYDSAIGRFEGEDPLDMAAGMNQFEYVGDAPVMGNDPFGLKVNFIPFEGAGAIPAASKCDVQLAKNEFKKIEDLAKEMEKKGHSELQQVLNHLKRKDVTYNIIVYPYMASHSDFTTYGDTKGNSAKTYFDPYAEASFDQNAPDYKRHALTPIIALIHELGHAYDYSGGAPIFPVQPISDLYTKNETRTSVQLENMVRGYLFGQDQLRTVYSEDATINPSSTPLKP